MGRPLGLGVGGWVLVCNCVIVQVVLQPSYVDYSTTTGQVAYSYLELQSTSQLAMFVSVYSARYVSHNLQSFKQGNF